MERTWKTKIKTPKKTSFLVLIFSMIAPAIFKNADLEAMLKTTSLWSQFKCSAAARLPAHTHLIKQSECRGRWGRDHHAFRFRAIKQ